MIYKFRSKATGDLIMLQPNGDAMLRAIGREPQAQGIIEPTAMAAAIGGLQRAIEADEAARQADDTDNRPAGISQRQRLYPMIEMLKRAARAGEPIVWGV
ncbi:MAG: DUF1840 domain-containing protein [Burkholderiales bacterium]|nr:DUF1840 domain-containing protein [Burkholderiales bacterium]